MATNPKSRPSFSPGNRWKIGLDAVLRTVLVLAVAVMLNYLGAKFYHRFYLSPQTNVTLSSRTLTVLHSLTNHVTVTLYYDRKANFYSDIVALLNEYSAANPKISVRTVDYVRDAGEAEKMKEHYRLTAESDKDLVIFDCDGRWKVFPGEALTQYKLEQVPPDDPKQKELEFRRKPVLFNGELAFTSMLLSLENPQPLKAYFLQGHGEPSLTDAGAWGYSTFGAVVQQNYVSITNLELSGSAAVPVDCNLLIIAGPTAPPAPPLSDQELQKIDQYLAQGGRLLVMFSIFSIQQPNGLESILQKWGVNVAADYVKDPQNTQDGQDVVVRKYSQHPVVNPITGNALQMILPRPIGKMNGENPPANAPKADEIAFSSASSTLAGDVSAPARSYPLVAAIEQKPIAGAANPRGNARLIVAGDSLFLGNHYIQGGSSGANRDFLNSALNWLLDRPQLVAGIGPRPVTEFRLLLTHHQQRQLRWLLLGALPGAVLFFGWLVWLARRT